MTFKPVSPNSSNPSAAVTRLAVSKDKTIPVHRPKYMSDPERCLETRATIKNMLSYVTDDAKIARHCAVSEAFVARVRRNLDPSEDACRKNRKVPMSHKLGIEDDGTADYRRWCNQTKRASEMLAKALGGHA